MVNTIIALFCIIIVLVDAQDILQGYDSCFTPEKSPGYCISIRNCSELLNMLKSRPFTREYSDYLRSALCGFEGLDAKVCCPFNDSRSTPPSVPKKETSNGLSTFSQDQAPTPHSVVKATPPYSSVALSLLPHKNECGAPSGDDRIFGGSEVGLFDFPWMALIIYEGPDGYSFYCGGALISKRYVLTAAHCLMGAGIPKNSKIVSVRLGEHNLETEIDCKTFKNNYKVCADKPIDVPVAKRIAHENYNPFDSNYYHDIALLKLKKNVLFTDFIKPICLPIYENVIKQSFAGTNGTVSGWGRTENNSIGSSVKLGVHLPVISSQECSKIYNGTKLLLSKGQVCAGGVSGEDTCQGDSGGPLMNLYIAPGEVNWYVVGITSFGRRKCGVKGWPGVYTRVTEYIPWIIKNMQLKHRKFTKTNAKDAIVIPQFLI